MMLEINGVRLEFDLSDYEVMEKFMKAQEDLAEQGKKADTEKNVYKQIKRYVSMFRGVFVTLFGEETAGQLVNNEKSASEWAAAFQKLIEYAMSESAAFKDTVGSIISVSENSKRKERRDSRNESAD